MIECNNAWKLTKVWGGGGTNKVTEESIYIKNSCNVLDEQKVYGQTNRRWICSTVQNNTVQWNTKNIIWTWTFEAWFHTYSLLMVNENVYFHAGIVGDRLLICYETSSQSCWKMWIWRLGFVCSYAWWCSTTYSFCILGIREHVSGTMNGTRWTTSMDCLSTCLSLLNFYLWVQLKSTVYTKEASDDFACSSEAEWIWDDSYDTWNFSAHRRSLFIRVASYVEA